MFPYDSFYADYTPPKGHPICWLYREKPSDLAYLSWGHRWYGDAPAVPSLHDGWHYFVLLEGSPSLIIKQRALSTEGGLVSICHPDCPVGHGDRPGARCEMLTWVWRSLPAHPALRPRRAGHLKLALDRSALRRLQALHLQCRQAIGRSDDLGLLQLRAARIELDLCLAGAFRSREKTDSHFQIDMAVEFVRGHLADQEAVGHLAEYLQISPATLGRLFRRHLAQSPRSYVLERRLEWARRQLAQPNQSVATVAKELGYLHANDFSRAFKRHYGVPVSRILAARRPAKPPAINPRLAIPRSGG